MIELFNLIKKTRAKTIKVKCEKVAYWKSETEGIYDDIIVDKTAPVVTLDKTSLMPNEIINIVKYNNATGFHHP